MISSKYLISLLLSVLMFALTGCGETKTENIDLSGTTPNTFTFTNYTGVALGATVTSNTITVSGLTNPAKVTITGGTYSIDNGSFVSDTGSVSNGQEIKVRHTAASTNSTVTTTTLTIGTASVVFTSKTLAGSGGGTVSAGQTLFTSKCSSCHTAHSISTTTVAIIKSRSMTYGCTDAELQEIVDYVATQ
jgi:hypothetical protein